MGQALPHSDRVSDAALLSTSVRLDEDVLLVEIIGELDLATTDQLERELARYQGTYRQVVYELERLAFIDCVGLHGLLSPIDGGHCDGPIKISAASRSVRRLLELTKLEHLLDL